MNTIFNENCLLTMRRMELLKSIDLVLTSPPSSLRNITEEEYVNWTISLFQNFDNILKKDGCILYNLDLKKIEFLYFLINNIVEKTNFTIVDNIVWKKDKPKSNNKSKNRLNRITENVFVFCRKDEIKTFNTNKKPVKFSEKLDRPTSYNDIDDFIISPSNTLDKDSLSIELVSELLKRYGVEDGIVYNPFISYGETAIAAKNFGMNYIGSEIDLKLFEYANSQLHCVNIVDDEYSVEVVISTVDDDFWN